MYTEAKTHQNCWFSSYHNSTTINENSMKKIQKVICSNGIHTKKYGIFSFNSPTVVRNGMSLPSRYLPRPVFLYEKDTLQYTLPSSCAHSLYRLEIKKLR